MTTRAVPDKRFLTAQGCLQTGDLDAAAALLDQLLAEDGRHVPALQLAARVAAMRSDWSAARDFLQRALASDPENLRCQYELAVARQMLGDIVPAVAAYEAVIAHAPDHADAHRRLADCLVQQGDLARACPLYQRVLELRPVEYHTLVRLGDAMTRLSREDEFVRLCETYSERFPALPGPYFQRGVLLQKRGDFDAAEACYRAVLARAPDWAQAHEYLGMIQRVRGDLPAAASSLREALRLRPGQLAVMALLSDVCEALNDTDEAERLAREVLADEPGHVQARRVLATILRRRQQPAEGYRLLAGAGLPADAHEAQGVLFELGKLADARGDYARAFEHFEQANAQLALAQRADPDDRRAYLDRLSRWRELFSPQWIDSWHPREAGDDIPAPVFLVGFPRSGTTLLDQILDSHPALQVLEEQPFMARIQGDIEQLTGGDLRRLATLPDTDWHRLRHAYRQQVEACRGDGDALLLVDKMPLNLATAGLCHWLFPEAVFILALRHPCDACLSCFMQPFSHNNAMASFYRLDDSADLYDRVMGLWQHYCRHLPIRFHAHRYEDLIDDFDATVGRLLDFLGLPWHDDVKAFDRHARGRGHINTPSYSQVAQPIYRSAKGRWHHYRPQLDAVLPVLRPWCEHFGYD